MDVISVIYNPASGKGNHKARLNELITELNARWSQNYRIILTKAPGDGIRVSRDATLQGSKLIIAAGGDGTINEVVNGILAARVSGSTSPELGIVNTGSGADFVRTLKLPQGMRRQLDIVLHQSARPVDLGMVQCKGEDGKPVRRYFVNECQVGIGGAVVSDMNNKRKHFGGTLDFSVAALRQLYHYKSSIINVWIDGQKCNPQELLGIVMANGIYSAGGMKMAPNAQIDDGFLRILRMSEMNLFNRLLTFIKVYSGDHTKSKYAIYEKAKYIEIDADRDLWIEADGELIGTTPAAISIVPGAIRVRY
ncbi:MAG: diacylglycerol kinase family lipid kinase [Saprospiraceae bacterium]|nr:diacylglycerol kinase family lipid kinase [Saprospiraceae bacterium]